MTATLFIVVVLWVAVTTYAVFAGADFGAGFWDLVAGSPDAGRARRALIDRSIGAVWETNHVWLIFVLVLLWTCFPTVYASIMSTLYIPLTLVAVGIILRGGAFAFRHATTDPRRQRLYGTIFGLSSVITPFFLGTVAGAVATGRVPQGNAAGDPITSWLNPTGILGGTLAVISCSFIAGVFLAREADHRGRLGATAGDSNRHGTNHATNTDPGATLTETTHDSIDALLVERSDDLVADYRRRAIGAAVAAGLVALGGILVLRSDAPLLFGELTGKGLPLILLSAVGGISAMVLMRRGSFTEARIAAVIAITSIIWGWGVAQYPYLLVGSVTIDDAAAASATMVAVAIVSSIGLVLLVPSLFLLYTLDDREILEED